MPSNPQGADAEEKKKYIMEGLLWPYVKRWRPTTAPPIDDRTIPTTNTHIVPIRLPAA
jgi:hypothetical protein